jgi:dolichyl-phosphate-mannose-protein mannosyltransferase
MTIPPRLTLDSRSSRFYAWMVGIFVFSLVLRFWGLERLNTLVFDEVYYAKFANNYLTQTKFFNAHPPLSQYLIAIGIAIGEKLPFGQGVVNDLTGSVIKTWSYRWLNALTGSFIPLVVAGLALQLTQRTRFAILVGILSALDGLFLVESRYALNNVYLVLFGLLGQICFLIAARAIVEREEETFDVHLVPSKSWFWMALSGFFLGCSVSIKWNGLWFVIAVAGLYALAWLFRFVNGKISDNKVSLDGLATKITKISPIALLLGLAIVPLTYYLLWIPHIAQNPEYPFLALQDQIYRYHKGSAVIGAVHPYCSTWQTWLTMLIPVAYFYKIGIDPATPLALNATNVPALPGASTYAVHAMGNPFLWWMTTGAIIAVGIALIFRLCDSLLRVFKSLSDRDSNYESDRDFAESNPRSLSQDSFTLIAIMVGYGSNLLPWMGISRCAFLYHYMGSSVFATLALAWWGDRFLARKDQDWGQWVWFGMGLAIVGFVWWLPVFLGLPLESRDYQVRMWFPTWVEGVNALNRKWW